MRLVEGRSDDDLSPGATFKRQRKDRGCGVLDGVGWGVSVFKALKVGKGVDRGPRYVTVASGQRKGWELGVVKVATANLAQESGP